MGISRMNSAHKEDSRIVKGLAWSGVEMAVRQLTTFAVFAVLGRLLGPTSYGLVGAAAAVTFTIQAFSDAGLQGTLVRRELDALDLDSAHWTILGLCTVLGLALALCSGPLAQAMGEPQLQPILVALSTMLPLDGASLTARSVLRRQLLFRLVAVRTLVATLAAGALGVLMALQGFGVWALVAFQLTRSFLSSAIVLMLGGWRPSLQYSWLRVRAMVGESSAFLGQSLGSRFAEEAPKFVLIAFSGPTSVAFYLAGRRFLDSITEGLLTPLLNVAMPSLAREAHDPERINFIFNRLTTVACLIAFPTFLGLAAISEPTIILIYGAAWREAALPVSLTLMIGVERAITINTVAALNACGKAKRAFWMLSAASALGVAATIAFGHKGLLTILLVQITIQLALAPASYFALNRLTNIDYKQSVFTALILVGCAGAMSATVAAWVYSRWAPKDALAQVTIGVLFGVAIYSFLIAIFARSQVRESLDFARLLWTRPTPIAEPSAHST